MRQLILFISLFILAGLTHAQSTAESNIEVRLIQYRVYITNNPDYLNQEASATTIYDELMNKFYVDKMGGPEYDEFIDLAFQHIIDDSIKVYSNFEYSINGDTPIFTHLMEIQEILSENSSADTVMVQSPYPPYDYEYQIYYRPFDPKTIVAIDFMERWIINKKTYQLQKQVIAYAPVVVIMDPMTWQLRGYKNIFWIVLNPEKKL